MQSRQVPNHEARVRYNTHFNHSPPATAPQALPQRPPPQREAFKVTLDEFQRILSGLVACAGDLADLSSAFLGLLKDFYRVSYASLHFVGSDGICTTFDPVRDEQGRVVGFESLACRDLRDLNWSIVKVLRKGKYLLTFDCSRERAQDVPDDWRVLNSKGFLTILSMPVKRDGSILGVVTLADREAHSEKLRYGYPGIRVTIDLFGAFSREDLIRGLKSCLLAVQNGSSLDAVIRSALTFFWRRFPIIGAKLGIFLEGENAAMVAVLRQGGDEPVAFEFERDVVRFRDLSFKGKLSSGTVTFDNAREGGAVEDYNSLVATLPGTKTLLAIPMKRHTREEDGPAQLPQDGFLLPAPGAGSGALCTTATGFTLGDGILPSANETGSVYAVLFVAGSRAGLLWSVQREMECCAKVLAWKLDVRFQGDLKREVARLLAPPVVQPEQPKAEAALFDASRMQSLSLQVNNFKSRVTHQLEGSLQVFSELGSGGFGLVLEGRWRGVKTAVKILPGTVPQESVLKVPTEVAFMMHVDHHNIVKTLDFNLDMPTTRLLGLAAPLRSLDRSGSHGSQGSQGGQPHLSQAQVILAQLLVAKFPQRQRLADRTWNVLVLEFCDMGTLAQAIDRGIFWCEGHNQNQGREPRVDMDLLLRTALEIARAMGYLHVSYNIMHGDLKPANLLLKACERGGAGGSHDRKNFTVKVADFGTSRVLHPDFPRHPSQAGTCAYMPPEKFGLVGRVDVRGQDSAAVDVYSFGIVMWEMYHGKRPYSHLRSANEVKDAILRNERPEFRQSCPRSYRRLAVRCWDRVSQTRPTFQMITEELEEMQQGLRGGWGIG